ncbi:MAG: helix-turn-helix domain-containing protein [Candidatus Hodarchaeota archaeon]
MRPKKPKRPPKKKLEKLLYEGYNTTEIAEHLGVSQRTVYDWLKLYGLPRPKQIISSRLLRDIVIDYLGLRGADGIAKQHHMQPERLRKMLEGMGFDLTSFPSYYHTVVQKRMKTCWLPISENFYEVICGELLGDGTLTLNKGKGISPPTDDEYQNALDTLYLLRGLELHDLLKKKFYYIADLASQIPHSVSKIIKEYNKAILIIISPRSAYFRTGRSLVEEEWVEYLADTLRSHGLVCSVAVRENKRTKKNITNQFIHLESAAAIQLTRLRRWFYPNGDKIIPHDLKLTATMVLHWYLGDGGCDSSGLSLYTHNFPKADVQRLANLLWQEIGIHFRLQAKVLERPEGSGEIRTYWMLYHGSREGISRFFTYLDSTPNQDTLNLAKSVFPWKFSTDLRKKDCV